MAEILHALRVDAPRARVFAALTDPTSLHGFWAGLATARATLGALVGLRVDASTARMRVSKLDEGAEVSLRCVDGPEGWAGTEITVELASRGSATWVRLRHGDWREATDAMGLSSVWWARFLFALKTFAETPEPDDLYL